MIRRIDKDDRVFRALSHATRREILDFLRAAPRTTGEICARFPRLDRCTVMQHLGVLERADLVAVRSEGRQRWNYLNVLPIKEIHDRWIGPYAARAADLLARLRDDLEQPAGDARHVESRRRATTDR
ncbi:MAG: ArsR/SmtB family transcription factor [Steroidobacteraceae bacterium]